MAKADKQNSPYSELSRKLKGSDYGSAIDTLQTDLGLLEASGAEMEALLIYIVNKCYRQKSYNVDITLMALGLLDGYNNRLDRLEPIEERDLYSERRDKFLKETNYIAIKYGDQAKTYEEAKQTLVKNQKSGKEFPLIERIRNSLNSSTTNCLVAVLTKLYKEKATRIVNSKYPDSAQVNEDTLTTDGFLIGSYGPGADAILTFMAEVTGDNLYEGVNELEGIGQIGVDGRTMQDSATVIVHNGEVPEPEPRPILTPLRILAFAVVCVCFAVIALFIKSHHGKER